MSNTSAGGVSAGWGGAVSTRVTPPREASPETDPVESLTREVDALEEGNAEDLTGGESESGGSDPEVVESDGAGELPDAEADSFEFRDQLKRYLERHTGRNAQWEAYFQACERSAAREFMSTMGSRHRTTKERGV